MARSTSVTLGEHFEAFIAQQISEGRFESKSGFIRAAMRLLEEHERKSRHCAKQSSKAKKAASSFLSPLTKC